jgi:hypothetical protein
MKGKDNLVKFDNKKKMKVKPFKASFYIVGYLLEPDV